LFVTDDDHHGEEASMAKGFRNKIDAHDANDLQRELACLIEGRGECDVTLKGGGFRIDLRRTDVVDRFDLIIDVQRGIESFAIRRGLGWVAYDVRPGPDRIR
jgi:hypothetical protein